MRVPCGNLGIAYMYIYQNVTWYPISMYNVYMPVKTLNHNCDDMVKKVKIHKTDWEIRLPKALGQFTIFTEL